MLKASQLLMPLSPFPLFSASLVVTQERPSNEAGSFLHLCKCRKGLWQPLISAFYLLFFPGRCLFNGWGCKDRISSQNTRVAGPAYQSWRLGLCDWVSRGICESLFPVIYGMKNSWKSHGLWNQMTLNLNPGEFEAVWSKNNALSFQLFPSWITWRLNKDKG